MSDLRETCEADSAPVEPLPKGVARQVLLVTGMHRSGTSATTGVLGILGASMPRRLMPAMPGVNESGFFEPARIVAIHDEMLDLAGSSWHDTSPLPDPWFRSPAAHGFVQRLREAFIEDYADAPLAALKDPRVCRFAPLWIEVLSGLGIEPLFVIPSRHPAEVAASLLRRDGFPTEKSQVLWLQHLLWAEHGSRGYRRSFLSYEEMMTDPAGVLARVGRDLGVHWPTSPDEARPRLQEFLARKHQHNRVFAQQGAPAVSVLPLAAEAYSLVEAMALNPRAPDEEAFDRLRREYLAADRLTGDLVRKLDLAQGSARAELRLRQAEFQQAVMDRDAQLLSLQQALADRDARITALTLDLQNDRTQAAALQGQVRDRQEALDEARGLLHAERARFEGILAAKDQQLDALHAQLVARDQALVARDQVVTSRDQAITERDQALANRDQALKAREEALSLRDQALSARDGEIRRLTGEMSNLVLQVAELGRRLNDAQAVIDALHTSSSWRLTAPLRAVKRSVRRLKG